jgi:hypothetical protein
MSSSTVRISGAEEVKKAASRRRSSKGKLRKHASLDGNIVVEEPIVFSLPNDSRNNNKNKRYQETNNNSTIVGDGCYISCTVHRTRYYGILVDQDTLTAASDL